MDDMPLLPGPEMWIFTLGQPQDVLLDQLADYMAQGGMNWIIVNIAKPVGGFQRPALAAGAVPLR